MKKGFISTAFLMILIVFISFFSGLMIKLQTSIKSIDNLVYINKRFLYEIEVINFVSCKLVDNSLEAKEYELNNMDINIEINNDEIICYVTDFQIIMLTNSYKIINYWIRY